MIQARALNDYLMELLVERDELRGRQGRQSSELQSLDRFVIVFPLFCFLFGFAPRLSGCVIILLLQDDMLEEISELTDKML